MLVWQAQGETESINSCEVLFRPYQVFVYLGNRWTNLDSNHRVLSICEVTSAGDYILIEFSQLSGELALIKQVLFRTHYVQSNGIALP